MRLNRFGSALITSASIIFASLIVAASVNMQYIAKFNPIIGRFWTSYFEFIGWPITFACVVMFGLGIVFALKRSRTHRIYYESGSGHSRQEDLD